MGWQELAASLLTCAVLLVSPVFSRVPSRSCKTPSADDDLSVYNFTIPDVMETSNISLSDYQELNALRTTYKDSGFEILGIPCNQFGKQEPGGNGEEIMNGITYVRPGGGFKPNFPILKKIDVNGATEHPLYTYLKSLCPTTRDDFVSQERLFYTPMHIDDIRWNFEKFLINNRGVPVKRYDATTPPDVIGHDVADLLMSQD